jgi:hypothetical protein
VEFVLEGLHLTKRLNKDALGGRATYRARGYPHLMAFSLQVLALGRVRRSASTSTADALLEEMTDDLLYHG